MTDFSLTRRQFGLAVMGSALALAASCEAQPEPSPPGQQGALLHLINARLAQPMPDDQAKRVGDTLQSLQKTAEALHAHPLPEGSEPALIFQPLPARRARR